MASWTTRKEELEKFAQTFDKSIRLYTKRHWLMRGIAWLLWIISNVFTLGKYPYDREKFFMGAGTTIGNLQFYPEEWSGDVVEKVIPHESIHTRQARYCGAYIHPLLGLPINLILYGLFLFPVKLAIGRALLELQAEREALRYRLRNGEIHSVIRTRAKMFAIAVASSFYFYALPESWCIKLFTWSVERMIQEETNNGVKD